MIKYFLFIFVSLFFFNQTLAKDVSIKENIDLVFFCNLEKKIIKNSMHNYRTYLAEELDSEKLIKLKIKSEQPDYLSIEGLSKFFSNPLTALNVKVVSKDVVLFKSIDEKNNYSESGIITKKTGELIHEITKNIKSNNLEKYISIYKCIRHE
ncbi:MAG: hypothetical protein CMI72_04870 [Candidatus Pelagibacter sp.]|nr:hypothetical protein [Candidatus Pelagibacter sp.]|tara:strand:- start:166 stop:621 length:456 start_codon:yes stop_codon:yes gene_type:complete